MLSESYSYSVQKVIPTLYSDTDLSFLEVGPILYRDAHLSSLKDGPTLYRGENPL